jgi:hypothetical protein
MISVFISRKTKNEVKSLRQACSKKSTYFSLNELHVYKLISLVPAVHSLLSKTSFPFPKFQGRQNKPINALAPNTIAEKSVTGSFITLN